MKNHRGGVMRLFRLFKQKKENKEISTEASKIPGNEVRKIQLEKKKVMLASKEDRVGYFRDNCEQIMEATNQLEEAKIEYQAVTSYLSDMQKIDMIPREDRDVLDEAARKIITLARERGKYQNSDIKITDSQFSNIEKYSDRIPTEIQKMKKNEIYQSTIKTDMSHLEGEKGSLKFQKDDLRGKQQYLKMISIITCILVILMFLLFFVISQVFENDMTIPYILTIIMAGVSILFIFLEARKNRIGMVLLDRKMNKAIGLLNRVKIKYVNTTNVLEYTYDEFSVNSALELEYLWNQYRKAKEEEKKYKLNTERLNENNEILIGELAHYGIADPDIWIYQATAILDAKEMVEVRHRLNVRRQKLRERIDYNTKMKASSINEIKEVLGKYPELKSDVISLLKDYDIDLS